MAPQEGTENVFLPEGMIQELQEKNYHVVGNLILDLIKTLIFTPFYFIMKCSNNQQLCTVMNIRMLLH